MDTYLYLSMIPESLVASMLPPSQFGTYLAVGTHKRTRGQAIYFDLKGDFHSDYFDLSSVPERCVPDAAGRPKHSVYLAIYRVLEHVPLEAVNSLWLVTRDGRVLELKPTDSPSESPGKYHLYQEICPVHPLIASALNPQEFCRFITDPHRPIHVPKMCFMELELDELADNPQTGQARNLPYAYFDHMRDCLLELGMSGDKPVKTVDRIRPQECYYRCVKGGFYLGDQERILHYTFPSHEDLNSKYYDWWRSVNV